MIHTVTVNPALDLTYRVSEIVFDDTVRADEVLRSPGGKGINVSRVAARLDHPTVAMGFVGGRAGEELLERLEAEAVRTWFTHIAGATRTNAIVQDASNHQIRVSGPGASASPEDVEQLVESLFDLRSPDVLALCGSRLPGIPRDFYANVARRAMADGIRVAIDADGDDLLAAVEIGAYLIKPNRYELERLSGKQVGTREDAVAASKPLIRQGITAVLTSLGAQGAVLVTEECALHAYAPARDGRFGGRRGRRHACGGSGRRGRRRPLGDRAAARRGVRDRHGDDAGHGALRSRGGRGPASQGGRGDPVGPTMGTVRSTQPPERSTAFRVGHVPPGEVGTYPVRCAARVGRARSDRFPAACFETTEEGPGTSFRALLEAGTAAGLGGPGGHIHPRWGGHAGSTRSRGRTPGSSLPGPYIHAISAADAGGAGG